MSKYLLEVKNICKHFQLDGSKLQILKDISFNIKKGEFTAIMGPSGSGKSTLMYLIGCLDRPSSGDIVFDNQSLSDLSSDELAKVRNRRIGFVFQMFNLLPRTTSLSNVMLPVMYSNTKHEDGLSRATELLNILGIGDRKDHSPNQLSGGEQQRVAIARALINNPDLIMADEPTGNLDTKSGKEIMEILKDLNQKGKTILLVTHDESIAKYARRIIKIEDGRIVRDN